MNTFLEPKVESYAKIDRLKDRAFLLKAARHFFDQRGILEVDCPLLSSKASVDVHIDLISAMYKNEEKKYLHSSPEYGMKRLLADGMGDIYQLSHVFRDNEHSHKHNPEFMMAEWYRIGHSLEEMIEETIQFIRLFLGDLSYHIISYRDALSHYCGFDYLDQSCEDLMRYIEKEEIPYYPTVLEEGKDALLNLILGTKVEPALGSKELTALAYYPASQSALAQKRWKGNIQVAERFEIYYKGFELANGYHELTDFEEQRQRFLQSNQMRAELGKEELPIDENFLIALQKGLPDCCGVAVGFDRLMMLRHHSHHISEILPFSWDLS